MERWAGENEQEESPATSERTDFEDAQEGCELLRQLDRDALAVSAHAYVRCDFMREGGERVDLAGVVARAQVGQDGLLGAGLVRNAGGVTDAEVLLLARLLGMLRKEH